jgi:hypothetical protein
MFRRKRKEITKGINLVIPDPEAVAAKQRALKALGEAIEDKFEMREHSRRSKLERYTNHFAPAILEAMESSRREK